MGVGAFVSASLDSLRDGRYDVALALACSAVDATAKQTETASQNNVRYKSFLQKKMRIVTRFGLPGIIAGGIRIKCTTIPDLKTDHESMVGIEDIIYHIIRCGLIHQCEIDKQIDFTDETFIGDFQGKFRMPANVVYGLLMAVVLDESNKDESLDKTYYIKINDRNYDLNTLWGFTGSL